MEKTTYLVNQGGVSPLDDGLGSAPALEEQGYGTDWILVEASSRAAAFSAADDYDHGRPSSAEAIVLDVAHALVQLDHLGMR